jgi:hypothetical protein
MKAYQIYFIVVKLLIMTQIIAVLLKKQTRDSNYYILSDTVFKLSTGLYLILFFQIHSFPGLDFEDTLILRFSGIIILLDIDYYGLSMIVRKYSPWLSDKIKLLETVNG